MDTYQRHPRAQRIGDPAGFTTLSSAVLREVTCFNGFDVSGVGFNRCRSLRGLIAAARPHRGCATSSPEKVREEPWTQAIY
jgi:hypothetical protein